MIQKRIEELLSDFGAIKDWEERYKKIIDLGKTLPPLDEALRIEANKVRGCQSQVWLAADFKNGQVIYFADSDAAIVKGIIALLLKIYSEVTPAEILATKPDFIDDLGLRQHLSMNRSNGLAAMLKQISLYAFAFKTKHEMGLI